MEKYIYKREEGSLDEGVKREREKCNVEEYETVTSGGNGKKRDKRGHNVITYYNSCNICLSEKIISNKCNLLQ